MAVEIPTEKRSFADQVTWLRDHGLYDPDKSQQELERRYKVFSQISMGDCAWESNAYYFQQLVHLENSFAVEQSDVGDVRDWPFRMSVRDGRPIQERPIQYAPPQRDFIKAECDKLLRTKVIEPAAFDAYLHKVVLVAGAPDRAAQSG